MSDTPTKRIYNLTTHSTIELPIDTIVYTTTVDSEETWDITVNEVRAGDLIDSACAWCSALDAVLDTQESIREYRKAMDNQ